nr:metallophosphoesterase family protein [Limobrevibacterium gyesilva]
MPPGQRVYAIGDVHGCADRLDRMHAAVAEDLAARPVARALVIHLGDYIDRGPDSAGVIERLIRPFPVPGAAGARVFNLAGNHEDMLLTALASGDLGAADLWLRNGGGDTLASWGIPWRGGPAAWQRAIPPAHLGFLRGLSLLYRVGGYVFVHAGLRPGVNLEAQAREDLLWIREPFLSYDGLLPAVAVHGHTPEDAPSVHPHRIGVDTGAVLGGPLSCAVLEADSVRFLQT